MKARNDAGFSLMEIMVALAILATGLLILLDVHYGALRLFNDTREEALMQGFLERVLGQAEMDVVAGKLKGEGDFGKRYPDYSFTYTAQPMGDKASPLYQVQVTVKGPTDSRSMMTMVCRITP